MEAVRHASRERHALRSHALPLYPSAQVHWPVDRSQRPRLEHSTSAWAVSVAVAESDHALPVGHAPVRAQKVTPG